MNRFKKLIAGLIAVIMVTMLGIPGIEPVTKSSAYELDSFVSLIGWDGDDDGIISYIDGSYYIRADRNITCSFGIYNDPVSLKWYNEEGYLPCLVTEFEKNGCTVKIKNFGDKVTVNGKDYVAAYSRVQVYNHSKSPVTLKPLPSKGLVPLTANSETVQPGKTVNHDYVIAADKFAKNIVWPSDSDLKSLGGWDEHYKHMKEYWDNKLKTVVQWNKLPDTRVLNGLKNGFINIHIIKDNYDLNVAENGYDQLYNHDQTGIIAALLSIGDYSQAKDWLTHYCAPGYPDGEYKAPWLWALYLMKTGDKEFVSKYFDSFVKGRFYNFIVKQRTGPNKTMAYSWGPDFWGYWTADNWSALQGLAGYIYICDKLGKKAEKDAAVKEYNSLLTAVNSLLNETISKNKLTYIPVQVNSKDAEFFSEKRNSNDSHMFQMSRWLWDGLLFNADQTGTPLNLIDSTYDWLYSRKAEAGLPSDTHGGFQNSGLWCTTYNVGHASAGLAGAGKYRSQPIKAYQFMIEKAMSGPYSWWEGIANPTDTPWEGTHPEFGTGACPHAWGISFNEKLVTESIIAEKVDGKIIIGRGIPDEWIAEGQVIDLSNYPIAGNKRMGVKIEGLAGNKVKFTRTGDTPAGDIIMNLPIFLNQGIASASAGKIDSKQGTVTIPASTASVTVTYKGTAPKFTPIPEPTPKPQPSEKPGGGAIPAPGNGIGLKGEYYNGKNFEELKLERTDAAVKFSWRDASPDPVINPDGFSVRWTGQVQPLYSEEYTFHTISDDGVRLWVDGKKLIDNWTGHASTEDKGTIKLAAGKKYDIKMEYFDDGGGATAKLLWSSPSQNKEAIPQTQLYSVQVPDQIVKDSFDKVMVNRAPADWECSESAGGAAVPSKTDRSIKLEDKSSSTGVSAKRIFMSQTEKFTVEFSIMLPKKADAFSISLMSGSTKAFTVGTANGGNLCYMNSGSKYVTVQPYSENKWHTVKLAADIKTGKYDIYVDQKLVSKGVQFQKSVTFVDSLIISSSGSQQGIMYFDNLKITAP